MNALSFSVITPCFQALSGLRETVAAVRAQIPASFEHLIIDGASTDGTREWLEQSQLPKVRWVSEPDSGVYAAMNKGVALARGQFLFFLGAGDLLLPEILGKADCFIRTLPKDRPRFVYGNVRRIAEGRREGDGLFTAGKLCHMNICHQAIFYERRIFDRLGLYDLKYPIYSDWAFNLRCFGDDGISRHYWNAVISEFVGNGLSDRVPDVPFAEDRVALICTHLGRFLAMKFRVGQKVQRGLRRLRGTSR